MNVVKKKLKEQQVDFESSEKDTKDNFRENLKVNSKSNNNDDNLR